MLEDIKVGFEKQALSLKDTRECNDCNRVHLAYQGSDGSMGWVVLKLSSQKHIFFSCCNFFYNTLFNSVFQDTCYEYCQTYRNKNIDKFREYAKNYYHEKIKNQP